MGYPPMVAPRPDRRKEKAALLLLGFRGLDGRRTATALECESRRVMPAAFVFFEPGRPMQIGISMVRLSAGFWKAGGCAMPGFLFDFPIYSLFPKGKSKHSLAILRISGAASVALFTDDDLAQRAAATLGLQVVELANVVDLLSVLEDLEGVAESVIFDPENKQRRPTILPLASAIEQLKADQDRME